MASRLNGLFRTLSWGDFRGPQPASNPNNMKAEAHPGFSPQGAGTESYSGGALWRLKDTLTISVTFDSARSWVLSSVRGEPLTEQNRLLKHEQGHYDLCALLARDCFIELMALKAGGFSSSGEVSDEVRSIYTRYQSIAQPLQDKYDSRTETDHGRNQSKQNLWNGYIQRAFTTPRVPAVTAPDGKSYKIEILTVLSNAGISV